MKTCTQQNLPEAAGTPRRLMIKVLMMSTLFAPLARVADANDSFQYNTLYNPSPAQLKAEERGRVMIYDGLDNALVERALDEQFDRIGHMMFIRTRQSASDDDEEDTTEDDGC